MKYLLADAIVYNDEDGSVSLINVPPEDAQILTCTANSIMKLLVQHHGNVVERETFLHDVWDRRGLQGSNNSLNQYISILRKMLTSLLPDVLFIVTVPRTGFMLSADVTVTALEEETPAAETAKTAVPARPERLLWGALTLAVVALCLWITAIKPETRQKDIHLLTHIGNCPVYTFTPLADVFHERAASLAQTLQQDGHLPCLENSIFYMHIQRTLFYGHEGRLVLSQCSLTQGKASACRTLYYYEW
ncbi:MULTISPECIES: winged helix-turn-helix domain-containing protein [Enterobacter]|uniref:winged helix-turn-helix domain-containing protein n=1 Tax=Enterobacter TaxID=547 RepID=UPI0014848C4E|nr:MULTISPECIES: winged helix-turn-helix domain-containing protein [Enterobacter]ELE9691001.1 winged helix-turn-helix domain-containing protein [Enterobacter kobei]MBO4153731.1 winged helix-turn-helix domain-containing protein [Enterobacter kobei]MCK7156424.1 winged helix-turn-helix domain-containing protein [Enterobacter kobei]MCK7215460.1 winged helix-turn-helix domain-containing protein [Enterobacter kobei]UOY66900.1 winged helix-turn-helix domain-containing protein [Enterobacter kobei]